ncbi:putative F420-dependent oxidoreductase, Rv2161c family [Frankia sp. EI5c]|uniref:TIGR03619 family F420-dependent LLM class oxidoreductase n=1 Tax=Frankia sp. EI5c TaxID=683316 RepID=UPI0007C2A073|nr:TIGR03619 family F420-dependent LLM class oxidoreductase [Frankia sp. EI5c]OAA27397.1 putative F420-dependent oxidoreductase, Rv2161c family [Frankia sp. EI5c]
MRFTVDYPVGGPGHDSALLTRAGVSAVARAAERTGFDAIAFTEHPAPSLKWLRHGGHETLDLTSALAFCAAVTERIRLMSHLLVLPYHNPFAAAKALTTVDLLSDGRLTVVAGTGYLRSEFRALGVDFETRNERFDESLALMRALWASGGVAVEHAGAHFTGLGVAHLPGPVQAGGPPVLVGGNSALARRRAARQQGWSPLIVPEIAARTSRTAALTLEMLPALVGQVRAAAVEHQGAGAAFTVQVQGPHQDVMRGGVSRTEYAEVLACLAEAGVDAVVLQPRCTSVRDAVAGLEEFAAEYF